MLRIIGSSHRTPNRKSSNLRQGSQSPLFLRGVCGSQWFRNLAVQSRHHRTHNDHAIVLCLAKYRPYPRFVLHLPQHHHVHYGSCVCLRQVHIVPNVRVQNSLDVCQPGVPCGRFVLSCIYFCYYVTTSIVCFFIYREFKAIKYDQDPRMRDFFAQAEQQRQQQRESNNDMNDDSTIIKYSDFAPNYGGRDK